MRILVPFKRVADPDRVDQLQVGGDGDRIETPGLEPRPNPFDHYALEAALRLTEDASAPKQRRGEVIVVSVGTSDVDPRLRNALATGADRAIRVEASDDQLDGRLIARVLDRIVARVQPDLVLMGKQAVDGDSNQVGQRLGEHLDWPVATFAATLLDTPEGLVVEREVDGGVERVRVKLPAVVTVDLRIVAPRSVRSRYTTPTHAYGEGVRFTPLLAVRQAQQKPLEVLALRELVGDLPCAVRTTRFELPPRRQPGVRVASVTELVARLTQETKVLR